MAYNPGVWHESTGVLRYGPGLRLILEVEQDIADYYRALLPKWVRTTRQRYPAHISVVRRVVPPDLTVWGRHDGEEVWFEYCDQIEADETYVWLNARSVQLEEIRLELGLERMPPWRNSWHITIGNFKEN